MKNTVQIALAILLVIALCAPGSTQAQTRNVTFVVNTATVPDTVAPGYTVQIRGNEAPLTWGGDTGGGLTNIGGDYWSKTIAFPVGANLQFKIFAGSDGWESDVANAAGGNGNRTYTVANVDTVLPVQFFNSRGNGTPQYFRPWTPVADTFMNVYFRVNMLGAEQAGLFGYNPNTDTVGIRGGGPAGGDLNWSPTFYLTKESPAAQGSFGVPARTFWSGRVRIPKSGVTVGQTIDYKYLIGYDWGRDELQGQPNRSFVVPTGKRDTTIRWVYFNNTRPSARNNSDTVRVTFSADLARAIASGGFAHGDTIVVRSGYFGTARENGREKRMIRIGATSIYRAIDTVVTALNNTFDYQYYVIRAGSDIRENYYNFYYSGETPAEAERRQIVSVPSRDFAINDTATAFTDARRQPDFPNARPLVRNVMVRWEVDMRPAYYQVRLAGDTLYDIQGSFHVTNADSVFRWGVWINGPATGDWASWGFNLQSDTTRKMWDNGTNGDRVANDSIYTRMILASPDSINIGTKGRIGQIFKFGIRGGDNEGGRGGFGNNHATNISDATSTYTVSEQWGSINPRFYNRWNYTTRTPILTGVTPIAGVPEVYELGQNYPNPFNPLTTIEYSIPAQSQVTLKVYNAIGQEVATLVNEVQQAAKYKATFDAANLASGVYFYRLTAGKFSSVKKLVVLK